jgi:hypothetical protein
VINHVLFTNFVMLAWEELRLFTGQPGPDLRNDTAAFGRDYDAYTVLWENIHTLLGIKCFFVVMR